MGFINVKNSPSVSAFVRSLPLSRSLCLCGFRLPFASFSSVRFFPQFGLSFQLRFMYAASHTDSANLTWIFRSPRSLSLSLTCLSARTLIMPKCLAWAVWDVSFGAPQLHISPHISRSLPLVAVAVNLISNWARKMRGQDKWQRDSSWQLK